MMHWNRIVVAAMAAVALHGQQVSSDDRAFIEKAAKGGMHEVQFGRMGLEKGSSQAVKSYSQRLVNDHTKANKELKALAKKKGVQLAEKESGPHGKGHGTTAGTDTFPGADGLMSKTGADFDSEFARMAVEDHQKDIAEFEKAANSSDSDVKAFANKTLPTLRAHLKEAESLQKK